MQPGSQETLPATGERTEPSQVPSKDTSSLDGTSDLGGPRTVTFDLFNMVVSYKRMVIFLEPVTDVVEVLRYLLGWVNNEIFRMENRLMDICAKVFGVCRWRMPLCSLFCCILLNILFITLSEGETQKHTNKKVAMTSSL